MTMTRKTGMLFRMFALNYGDAWGKKIAIEADRLALAVMWERALEGFSEELVNDASLEAVKFYSYPPNIQQFLEILKPLARGKKLDENTVYQLGNDKTGKSYRAPPSRLLAEYMAKHGIADDASGLKKFRDDPIFNEIRTKYQGAALGKALVAEICRRVKVKHAKS